MHPRILMLAAPLTVFLAGPALADGTAVAGAVVFHNHCDSCHSALAIEGDGNGPNLAGIMGRKAGSVAGFEYSQAMRNSGITWGPDTLTQFVQGPDALVPGTKMARTFKPVALADTADLVAYLQDPRAARVAPAAPAAAPPPPETPAPPPPDAPPANQ